MQTPLAGVVSPFSYTHMNEQNNNDNITYLPNYNELYEENMQQDIDDTDFFIY
jgi:hypothetical protein